MQKTNKIYSKNFLNFLLTQESLFVLMQLSGSCRLPFRQLDYTIDFVYIFAAITYDLFDYKIVCGSQNTVIICLVLLSNISDKVKASSQ